MLVITRKPGQSLVVDDVIAVRILEIRGGRVRLGINAPPEVSICRRARLAVPTDESERQIGQPPLNENQ